MARTEWQLTAWEILNAEELHATANDSVIYKNNSWVIWGIDIVKTVVTTGGTTTLTNLANAIEVSWTLVSNATIIVPNKMVSFIVDNTTTGAFTLTVKTALWLWVVVAQWTRVILYANGTDVELGASGAGGSWDMILASSQTNSGLKTFLNWTFGLRNIANTFTSFFSSAATASRTYTLQDRDWTIADNTDLALKADINSPAFTWTPTSPTAAAGDSSTQIATTAFVQWAVRSVPSKEASKYGTTTALPSVVYNNGTSWVGATLTAVAVGALSIDWSSPIVGDRILVKNQVSTFQNGIYTVTATGSGIAVFVLTRAVDFDQSTDIVTGASTYVTSGSTLASTTWDVSSADSPVMGTDAITFVQTAGPGSIIAGTGISISGSTVAIDTAVVPRKTDNLSVFAATTSAQLAGVISDETGSGSLVFGNSPTLATPVINGLPTGTGIASAATASTVASRDANANTFANNHVNNLTSTATAAGTTTLTAASSYNQFFTGTTTQTVVLPVVTTLTNGHSFLIENDSTGIVTVNTSGGNTLVTIPWGTFATVICKDTTAGTGVASWESLFEWTSVTSGKKLSVSNTITLAGTDSTTITFQWTDTYVGRTTTDTLTNKRITRRVLALSANSATPSINTDSYDVVHITSQTAAITSFTTNLTGTPVDGDTLRISVTGTAAVALTFWTSFEASTVALPTTTVGTTRLDIGFMWNTETSKWRCVAVA